MSFGGVVVLSCRYSSWGFLLLRAILAYVGYRDSFSMMHATCGGLVQGLRSVVGVSGGRSVVVGPERRWCWAEYIGWWRCIDAGYWEGCWRSLLLVLCFVWWGCCTGLLGVYLGWGGLLAYGEVPTAAFDEVVGVWLLVLVGCWMCSWRPGGRHSCSIIYFESCILVWRKTPWCS